MQKFSTMRANGRNIFKGQLTIGLDLGDRSNAYCVLNEASGIGAVIQADTAGRMREHLALERPGTSSACARRRCSRGAKPTCLTPKR